MHRRPERPLFQDKFAEDHINLFLQKPAVHFQSMRHKCLDSGQQEMSCRLLDYCRHTIEDDDGTDIGNSVEETVYSRIHSGTLQIE